MGAFRANGELIVGVTARRGDPEWVQGNTKNYLNVLASFNVTAVVLAPDTPATLPSGKIFQPDDNGRLPDEILQHLDGLILAGGGDVHPRYFGAEFAGANPDTIDVRRDELELGLARQALAIDLPIFGICRGCQVLNVAGAGGMVQHFEGHRSSTKNPELHPVTIQENSRLFQIVGVRDLQVNTYHHQGIDQATLAALFQVSALAQPDDWLVEAYESPEHRWVLGVQWHPERLFELPETHRRLWESFVGACTERRTNRQPQNHQTER